MQRHTVKTRFSQVFGTTLAAAAVVLVLILSLRLSAQSSSYWVYFGPDNLLQYQTDDLGNQIMDFSFAGYGGGGVALPNLPVRATVYPVDGDNTDNIQSAIDQVSQLDPDADGFRGTVLLAAGSY